MAHSLRNPGAQNKTGTAQSARRSRPSMPQHAPGVSLQVTPGATMLNDAWPPRVPHATALLLAPQPVPTHVPSTWRVVSDTPSFLVPQTPRGDHLSCRPGFHAQGPCPSCSRGHVQLPSVSVR